MFSGIVETTALVSYFARMKHCCQMTLKPYQALLDLYIGDSVAINGVCLTITECLEDCFTVIVVPETLSRTNLGMLSNHSIVNLERSLSIQSRIHGHYVQGHIEESGTILEITPNGEDVYLLKVEVSKFLSKYIVHKGYIALDGMSMTVIQSEENWFTVTLIPHTRKVTIAQCYQPGSKVNIEVDVYGKYVEKMINNK